MSLTKISSLVNRHINNNLALYIISIVCVFAGIILGVYSVRYMGSFEKNDLASYINNFSSVIHSNNINPKSIFFQTLKNHLPLIIGIWFLGLTMIGIPVILVLNILKGFTVGFSLTFMVNQMGVKGLWLSLLGVVPQNIIYIPALIVASVLAMEFSLTIFKEKNNRFINSNIWVRITSYSFAFTLLVLVMFLGFFAESYITPNLMKFVVAKGCGLV